VSRFPSSAVRRTCLAALALLVLAPAPALAAPEDLSIASRVDDLGGGAPSTAVVGRASLSGDGRYVAFLDRGDDLTFEDDAEPQYTDAFLRDRVLGTTTLVSRATGPAGAAALGHAYEPQVSEDGRFVVFRSGADNLSAEDDNRFQNLFRRDLVTGTTVLVSRADGAGGAAFTADALSPSVSADGGRVAFVVAGDVLVRDVAAGTTTLAGRADGPGGAPVSASSPAISGDGTAVAFVTSDAAISDEDEDSVADVFVRDLAAGETTFASRAGGAFGEGGDDDSSAPRLSHDGGRVLFGSDANGLSAVDQNGWRNLFVRDLADRTTTLVNRRHGAAGDAGLGGVKAWVFSDDGETVAFTSGGDNLSEEDGDAFMNVFVRSIPNAATVLVSRATGPIGAPADADSAEPALSRDGLVAGFTSDADSLSGEVGAVAEVYVREMSDPPGDVCQTPGAILGTAASQTLTGTPGPDVICGRGGNDTIRGLGGDDILVGEDGDDILTGGAGADRLLGGAGRDRVRYDDGLHDAGVTVTIGSGSMNDGLPGEGDVVADDVENVWGSFGSDSLTGDLDANELRSLAGTDTLHGAGGDDALEGGAGPDVFDGGPGRDKVWYPRSVPVTVTMAVGADDGQAGEGDEVTATIEQVNGGGAGDTLIGTPGRDYLYGAKGDDTITGGAGADQLHGEAGDDTLLGDDGEPDLLDCQDGTDVFDADLLDTTSFCEIPVP
jgi:Ca2+-binding RTX toxin-like protein